MEGRPKLPPAPRTVGGLRFHESYDKAVETVIGPGSSTIVSGGQSEIASSLELRELELARPVGGGIGDSGSQWGVQGLARLFKLQDSPE